MLCVWIKWKIAGELFDFFEYIENPMECYMTKKHVSRDLRSDLW